MNLLILSTILKHIFNIDTIFSILIGIILSTFYVYKGGYKSDPERYTFDQWLNYLEFKQVQHHSVCPKKEVFIKKISKDFSLKKNKTYAPILSI